MINDHYLINILNYLGDDTVDISHINNKLLLYIYENRNLSIELQLPLDICKNIRHDFNSLLISNDEYQYLYDNNKIIKTTFVGGLIECVLASPDNEKIKDKVLSVFNIIKNHKNLSDLFNDLCDGEKVFINILSRASNSFINLSFIKTKWIFEFCIKNKASLQNTNRNDDVLPFLLVRNRNWDLLYFLILSTPSIINEKNGNGVRFSIFMEKYLNSSLQLDKKLEIPNEIAIILNKNYLENNLNNSDDSNEIFKL